MQLHGVTCPLLTKSDGTKMGKTESGALWLSADRTSPYQFYQYWFNTQDADVGKCLRYFTDMSQAEIEQLEGGTPPNRAAEPRRNGWQRTSRAWCMTTRAWRRR